MVKYQILLIVLAVELVPLLVMMRAVFIAIVESVDKMIDRCVDDVKYRNNIASIMFFFSDMGPNVSSFSVIALFITSDENWLILSVIFFFGIIMKEVFRRLKNIFYEEIQKRSI